MRNFFITIGHSSLTIPKNLKNRINPSAILLELVEPGLIEVCKNMQAKKVIFDLHRAILDINRSRDNVDPKTNKKYPIERDLFPKKDFQGNDIYLKDSNLSDDEKEELLQKYYDPFFASIDNLISSGEYEFFIDIHLMNNNSSGYEMKNPRPDICIGTLGDPDGEICLNRPSTTIKPETAREMKLVFENNKYSCDLNRPFAGGYIMMKYLTKFPCIQLEINKKLLMDSDSGMPKLEKIKKLKEDLETIFEKIG